MEYRPLSESLPVPLPNGQQVRAFAKHCPGCHAKVEACHMRGLARSVEGQVFLAARASCPQCGHSFNVSCTIAADKTVSRLWVPAAFMLWWLSGLKTAAVKHAETPVLAPVLDINPELSPDSLGTFNGAAIPAWIDWQGRRYRFERTDTGAPLLQDGELRYRGLVFRRLEDTA